MLCLPIINSMSSTDRSLRMRSWDATLLPLRDAKRVGPPDPNRRRDAALCRKRGSITHGPILVWEWQKWPLSVRYGCESAGNLRDAGAVKPGGLQVACRHVFRWRVRV